MDKTKIINYDKKKIEVCIEDEQKGRSFDEIEIPKGWKLWTHQMCIALHNNKRLREELNLEHCSFWIEQFFEFNKENGHFAWFYAYSVRVGFAYSEEPQDWGGRFGVRFWREVK